MAITTNSKETPFDPTVSFMFFGTWVQSIELLHHSKGVDAAFYLFMAIAEYCMYDEEPDFSDNPELAFLWPVVRREADMSIRNRRAQFKEDEMNGNRARVRKLMAENPTLSNRKIAALADVSASTVDRVAREDQVRTAIAEKNSYKAVCNSLCEDLSGDSSCAANSDNTYSGDKDSYYHIDNYDAYDTVTRRSDALDEGKEEPSCVPKEWHQTILEETIEFHRQQGIDMSSYEGICDDDLLF